MPRQCDVFDKVIVAIAANFAEAYPSSFGLSGENSKMQLRSDLSERYEILKYATDEDYTAQVFQAAIAFSDDVKRHYVKEQIQLDNRNMLTVESAGLLSDTITAATDAYLADALFAFEDYEKRKLEALTNFATDKLVSVTAMSSALVLWAVLIGIMLLLVVFAMERHQRKLALLENLANKGEVANPTISEEQNLGE